MMRETRRCGQFVAVSTGFDTMLVFRQCTGLTDAQLLHAAGVRPGQAVELEVRVVTPAPAGAAPARHRPRPRPPVSAGRAPRPSRVSERYQECAAARRAELAAEAAPLDARTRAQLHAAVPHPSWVVDITLTRLRRGGVVERVGRGMYRLAEGGDADRDAT
jgi:hypothetical protein